MNFGIGSKLDNIDWEISVQDAIDYNRIITDESGAGDSLQLDGLHISDLTGLNNIENKENITRLILRNNKLTRINANAFEGFKALLTIDLSDNNITLIDPAAFHNILLLQTIILENNNITLLNPDILKGLNSLIGVFLAGNIISEKDKTQLENKYEEVIFVWK